VAVYSTQDASHQKAAKALPQLQRGTHGKLFVSDYVLAETLNYFVAKSRDPSSADRIATDLLGEKSAPWLQVIPVDGPMWAAAREKFRALSKAGLSFTDCTSIAAIELLGLDAVVSYDGGFDGLVPRLGD